MKSKTLRLIFDETSTVGTEVNPFYKAAIKFKLDGTKNTIDMHPDIILHEPDALDSPVVFPAFPYNPNLLEDVRKYYEIFNVLVISSPASFFETAVANKGSSEFVLKLYPLYVPDSEEFNNLPVKYNNFKRWLRFIYKSDNISPGNSWKPFILKGKITPKTLGQTFPNYLYGIVNNFYTDNTALSATVAHEAGHCFGLGHWGDNRGPDILKNTDNSYYGAEDTHNINWSPIMGAPRSNRSLAQWSSYFSYPESFCGKLGLKGRQDDVADIQETADLVKKPADLDKKLRNWKLDLKEQNHKKQAIFYTSDVGNQLYGLFGYPYDYDIVKILFKKGSYKVKASPFGANNRMTDCAIKHLKCKCEKDKQINNIDMSSDFGDTYSSPGQTLSFQKILVGNDDADINLALDYVSSYGDLDKANSTMAIIVPYTTLVYLKIRGDNGAPVDSDDNPTELDVSWSRYGALGKYQIEIDTGGVLDPGSDIPGGHCEKFTYCSGGGTKEIILFVQDKKDLGNGDPNKLHILELDIIENGKIKKKKFLVYGQPIDADTNTNTPEYEGKFFLTVRINGECKKQEFVVGLES